MRKINNTSASWNLQWRRCVMFNRMENVKVDTLGQVTTKKFNQRAFCTYFSLS
jgi:hypothetical protein